MYNPVLHDVLLGEEIHGQTVVSPYDVLAEYEAMDKDARFAFWKKEFDKCIRCYACRKPVRCAIVIPSSIRINRSGDKSP